MMTGFLKTPGWVFKLQPKTTTVGRHRDCDLCLQNGGVEECHALVAWSEAERCFILTDLNSAHGTFVNDCRVHNASVRLAPGDKLHFGYGGSTYQLDVDVSSLLPLLQGQSLGPQAWLWGGSPVTPKPPSQAPPRAASAGAKRSGQQSGPSERWPAAQRPVSWTGNTRSRSPQAAAPGSQTTQHLLQHKEERLLRLGDELRRLAVFEGESHRKDGVISQLRDQVAALSHQLTQNQPTTTTIATAAVDPEVKRRLRCLERNITEKKQQIQQLKEQMVDLQRNSIEMSRQSVTEKDMRISGLRGQLERLKKDSSTASGLVSSLQKDLFSREKQALKLSSEVDKLRQDIRHKDIHLEAQNTKFAKMIKKHQEELLNCENDMLTLKKSIEGSEDTLRQTERCLQQQVAEKDSLKNRFEKKVEEQESLLANTEAERRAQLQRNQAEMEQMEVRIGHFRSQLFSMFEADHCDASGMDSTSHDALSDQQVLERVASQLGERERLMEQLKQRAAEQDSLDQGTEGLRTSLDACQSLQEACSAEVLEKMRDSLKEQSVPEALGWVQASVLSVLTVHLSLLRAASQVLQETHMQVPDTPQGILNGVRTLCLEREAHSLELQCLKSELKEVRGCVGQSRELTEQLEQQRLQMAVVQQEEQARQKEVEELRGQADSLREAQNALQQEAWARQDELLSKLQEAEGREERSRVQEEEGREERERSRVQEEEYREQVRQHAHTIVALEQHWAQARLSAQSLEEERDSLRAQLREIENSQPVQSNSPAQPSSNPPEAAVLEDTITSLRADLVQAQQEARNHGDIITALSCDLAAANGKITDMTGELSEQQKLEMEQHRAVVVDQRVQLSMLTQKLSLMSQLVEQKGEELRKAKEELRQFQTELENRITAETEQREQHPDQSQPCLPQHTKEAAPDTACRKLAKQGSKCKGHRHDEVILHQREALAEMRSRIRTLEQTSALMRVGQQAVPKRLTNSERSKLSGQRSAVTKDSVTSSNGWSGVPGPLEEESLERTARLELSDALDLSERTYLDLARALCEALEVSEGQLEGLESLQHLPQEERARLGSLRHRDLELLCTRLALQHSHGQRRDTLVQEQSREISSLRESQAEGLQLRARLEGLSAEVERQALETSLLRQALEQNTQQNTQRQTDQQTGPAGRIHKTASQERTQRKSDRTVSNSCVRSTEPSDKAVAKKASLPDRLKDSERQVETNGGEGAGV